MIKTKEEILEKLEIVELNQMQIRAEEAFKKDTDLIILSPTGTGKTLAFLLPIFFSINNELEGIQTVIVVPSRELALQIEKVIREIGSGYKVNAFYGGRNFSKDRQDLNTPPTILVATPGRLADHLKRNTFETKNIKFLILDEFDKSLEIGFEEDMRSIIDTLNPSVEKKILTSATDGLDIPQFVRLKQPQTINFLYQQNKKLKLKTLTSPNKDKKNTLLEALNNLGEQQGIVFCNFKDSIESVSNYLTSKGILHGCFFGGMEQRDRERTLIKFRNGTFKLIIATDLAARGLDIPELSYIIHYELPHREEEFIHRNGRTARMNQNGTAYILNWVNFKLPDFIKGANEADFGNVIETEVSDWTTIMLSGGRKDKISKGDIAGLFMKQGNLKTEEIGNIELKADCAFIAVEASVVEKLLKNVSDTKLKTKKVRLTVV